MKYLSLFFSLTSFSIHAQMGSPNNLPNAAVNTVVAALHTLKKSDVPVDSISGSCSYRNGSCNGAQIALFLENTPVYQSTLTSLGHFKIPNLKRHVSYTLKLTWTKHSLAEVKQVNAGEFVNILLSEK